jgi:hypothetical protein
LHYNLVNAYDDLAEPLRKRMKPRTSRDEGRRFYFAHNGSNGTAFTLKLPDAWLLNSEYKIQKESAAVVKMCMAGIFIDMDLHSSSKKTIKSFRNELHVLLLYKEFWGIAKDRKVEEVYQSYDLNATVHDLPDSIPQSLLYWGVCGGPSQLLQHLSIDDVEREWVKSDTNRRRSNNRLLERLLKVVDN